jgi:hypothetical protein
MPGIEPGPPGLEPWTVRPPFWWITDQLRPIETVNILVNNFPLPSAAFGAILSLRDEQLVSKYRL